MENSAIIALYESIDKQFAAKDAKIEALQKALLLAWAWIDDTELEGALLIAGLHHMPAGDRLGNLLAEARHAKDMAAVMIAAREE